jgi:hypothetical protein
MSLTSTPRGRTVDRLITAGLYWQQYDVEAITAECLLLGVDPGEVSGTDLLQIAAKHRLDLRADAPCPSWCTEGHGHDYMADGEEFSRTHRRPIGMSDELGIEVELEAFEKKSSAGTVTVDEPVTFVTLNESEHDAARLRRLAALLLEAADAADAALSRRQWTEDDL